MLDNPEMIQAAIRSNPQMRELMDNNPEIGHMINNPNLMRQALEMARNPSMMQVCKDIKLAGEFIFIP